MPVTIPAFPPPPLRALFAATSTQVGSLRNSIEPLMVRNAAQPAADSIVADARRVLAATARIMSRERGWRAGLTLHSAPSWAALASKLALAGAALHAFNSLYIAPYEDEDGGWTDLPL